MGMACFVAPCQSACWDLGGNWTKESTPAFEVNVNFGSHWPMPQGEMWYTITCNKGDCSKWDKATLMFIDNNSVGVAFNRDPEPHGWYDGSLKGVLKDDCEDANWKDHSAWKKNKDTIAASRAM